MTSGCSSTPGRHREARRDAVDQHPVAPDLLRQRARERDDRALARHVVQQERHPAERRPRGDVHDLAAPVRLHHGHHGATGQEHRRDVDVHDRAPLVERDLGERPHRERGVQPGVVDQDVDRAAARDDIVGHALHVGLLRDVDGEADAVRERPRRPPRRREGRRPRCARPRERAPRRSRGRSPGPRR